MSWPGGGDEGNGFTTEARSQRRRTEAVELRSVATSSALDCLHPTARWVQDLTADSTCS